MPFLATASSGSGGYGGYLILLLPLVLLGYMFWSQRRRQKNTQQQQAAVTIGSEVATTSGIYGIVTEVQEPVVAVEVAPGVTLHVDRRAVLPRASLAGRAAPGVTPQVPGGRYGELPAGATLAPASSGPVTDPATGGTTYGEAIDHGTDPGADQDIQQGHAQGDQQGTADDGTRKNEG